MNRPVLPSRRLLVPALFGLLIASAPAQSKRSAEDAFTPVRIDMAEMIEEGAAVGLVGAGTVGGELVFAHAAGMRDREAGAEVDVDTIFRIFSMTKPITCVAALTFYDEKRFELDDPVSDYLPELVDLKIEGKGGEEDRPLESPMKVRDLFQHTSGWSYETPWERVAQENGNAQPDLEDMVTALSTLPLLFQPGSRWEYGISNDVLGRFIEVLAEKPLDEVFQERIFAPLGMSDTGFHVDEEDLDRLMRMYFRMGKDLVADPETAKSDPTRNPAHLSGGGGLYSTAGDYLRFLAMMRGKGSLDGKRVLKSETVALMLRDQIGDIPRSMVLGNKGYGLGVSVVTEASELGGSLGTWSWGGAAGTMFWVDPEQDEAVILMNQTWLDFGPAFRFAAWMGPALAKTSGKRQRHD